MGNTLFYNFFSDIDIWTRRYVVDGALAKDKWFKKKKKKISEKSCALFNKKEMWKFCKIVFS